MQYDIWKQIGEYVRWTPSPHNTQPLRLKVLDEYNAEAVFIPARGLYVADPQGRFTMLTFGIFVEIAKIAAASLGYRLEYTYTYQPLYQNNDVVTPQTIATLTLHKEAVQDLNANLILKRHTSRLPYNHKPVAPEIVQELQAEAVRFGHTLTVADDAQAIKWIIELNKDSLLNDLENNGIRTELIKWLRFSKREAQAKKDGLSAECLIIPGPLLRAFFFHHRLMTLPGIKQLVVAMYKATMRGIPNVAWLRGPFITPEDMIRAGHLMIRLWLLLTQHGAYWHPYGSVITNDKSRQQMLQFLGLPDEEGGKQMVWLLLRMGYSQEPPHSERLPLESYFL